ncbi:MAG: hypothetical protein HKN34_08695 [Gammaproteobacteria bacterium]|nr:hypothetical protein [Gammaproteobacteria bacterium]
MDNVFVFGGDGGGILFESDMRRLGHFSGISFDPIDTEGSTEEVASNFGELLAHVEEYDA